MCLKWNPQGTHIATGSIDTIRVWDAHTGTASVENMGGGVRLVVVTPSGLGRSIRYNTLMP